jgi:hypothetical protein
MIFLDENGDFLFDEHRDMDGLGHRDVDRVRLRNVDVVRDEIRHFHRDLYSIWNLLFYCDGDFLFNNNWIGFGHMHRDRYFLLDVDRDVNFYRDRDFLLYRIRNWVWDWYFNFLCNSDGLDIFFLVVLLAASEGMFFTIPSQAGMLIAPKGMSCIP